MRSLRQLVRVFFKDGCQGSVVGSQFLLLGFRGSWLPDFFVVS